MNTQIGMRQSVLAVLYSICVKYRHADYKEGHSMNKFNCIVVFNNDKSARGIEQWSVNTKS